MDISFAPVSLIWVLDMRCPECHVADLVEYPNLKECPFCHFVTYFGYGTKKIRTEPDFGAEF
jgi:hypothetical protein